MIICAAELITPEVLILLDRKRCTTGLYPCMGARSCLFLIHVSRLLQWLKNNLLIPLHVGAPGTWAFPRLNARPF